MQNDPEIPFLLSLLDDPDEVVRQSVVARFKSKGQPVLHLLRKMRASKEIPAPTREKINTLIAVIAWNFSLSKLEGWIKQRFPDTLEGMLLVQQCILPETDIALIRADYQEEIKTIWTEFTDNQTTMEKVSLFNYLFYNRLSYTVEDPFISDPDLAHIGKVCRLKKGNPIVLGILYVYMARQLGVPIKGICFRGGFLPVVVDSRGAILFYINVYKRGSMFRKKELEEFMEDYDLDIPAESFAACTPQILAGIYAESLTFLFANREETDKEEKMETVLSYFGPERYLFIEEDDEE